MTQLCRKPVHVNIKWSILERVSIVRNIFSFIWDNMLVCSIGRPIQYRRLTCPDSSSSSSSSFSSLVEVVVVDNDKALAKDLYEADSDLVSLKINLLGDCQIGKTSFLIKYVGDEQEKSLQMTGLNLINKTLFAQGVRISFSIWDVRVCEGLWRDIALLVIMYLTRVLNTNTLKKHEKSGSKHLIFFPTDMYIAEQDQSIKNGLRQYSTTKSRWHSNISG